MQSEILLKEKISDSQAKEAGRSVFDTLNILGDELLIIDIYRHEVSWCSSTFQDRFKEILPGSDLTTLYRSFDGIEDAISRLSDAALSAKDKITTVVHYQEKTGFNIELMPLDERQLLVRFKDISAHRSEIQRYLQDREKLFSTSRTISVSEMATTLAHEINQPIGTIKNLLQGIRSRLLAANTTEDATIAATERAIEQTQFAARIISRIRDYTQARTPAKTDLDLVMLVQDCVSLLDWEIDQQDIDCQVVVSSEPLMISGDELMLQQVFVNLLRNAIDAMRDLPAAEKFLSISAQVENDQVTIRIKDSGCGLNKDTEKKLFQPFVSTKPTGMGVGLNICRSFIELHQGRLWLTTNDQVGCSAYVLLPMLSEKGK